MNSKKTVCFDNLIEVSEGSSSFGEKIKIEIDSDAKHQNEAIKKRAKDFGSKFKAGMYFSLRDQYFNAGQFGQDK